jgi:phospholipase A2
MKKNIKLLLALTICLGSPVYSREQGEFDEGLVAQQSVSPAAAAPQPSPAPGKTGPLKKFGKKVEEVAKEVGGAIKKGAEAVEQFAAGKVLVFNEIDEPVYVALYQRIEPVAVATRIGDISEIAPGAPVSLQRNVGTRLGKVLHRIKGWERVVVATQPEDLKPKLGVGDLNKLIVGELPFVTGQYPILYVAYDKGTIKTFTALEWKVKYPLVSIMPEALFWKFIDKQKEKLQTKLASKRFPERAVVTQGTALSAGEQAYLSARLPKVKKALESMLNMKLEDDELPRIAFCCSGGGYRAMLATLGLFKGAEQTGLLDVTLYASALSGSSWFLAPWITSGLTLNKFHEQLLPKLKTDLTQTKLKLPDFKNVLLLKYIFNQPISLTDVYGGLLTQRLLSGFADDPYRIFLADQAAHVADGNLIYPIYTAVLSERNYEWVEFTPHVVGSDYLNAYVPSWAFGRKFDKGKSVDLAPSQNLGFFMGIWGSAFGVDFVDILRHKAEALPTPLRGPLTAVGKGTTFAQTKLLATPVLNYTKGLKGPYGLKDNLNLVDAGIDTGNPLPVLIKPERKVDIIVLLDSSEYAGDVKKAKLEELAIALRYARRKGHPMPNITEQDMNQPVVVFEDKDPSVPTILYVSLSKNDAYSKTFDPYAIVAQGGYLKTANFLYTNEQANMLIGLTEFGIKNAHDTIVRAIQDKVDAKRRSKGSLAPQQPQPEEGRMTIQPVRLEQPETRVPEDIESEEATVQEEFMEEEAANEPPQPQGPQPQAPQPQPQVLP